MADPTNSAAALTQLQGLEKTDQDPNTILSNQKQQLGVSSAQDTVTGLRGAINNTTKLLQQVAPSVMGRTGSSLVTNAQASKQIQNEQAPISANLTQEGTDYNNATTDLNNLEGEANTAASGIYQGQQDKLSYAQNLYNTMYQKEQDAQTAAQAKATAAEQIREFNANLAESKSEAAASAASSFNLGGSSAAPKAAMTQRNGGGFNFTDSSGTAVSAAKYAQLTGTPIGNLLQQMGAKGDKYAQQAYNEIKGNQAYYNAHPDVLKSEMSALFWGT